MLQAYAHDWLNRAIALGLKVRAAWFDVFFEAGMQFIKKTNLTRKVTTYKSAVNIKILQWWKQEKFALSDNNEFYSHQKISKIKSLFKNKILKIKKTTGEILR